MRLSCGPWWHCLSPRTPPHVCETGRLRHGCGCDTAATWMLLRARPTLPRTRAAAPAASNAARTKPSEFFNRRRLCRQGSVAKVSLCPCLD
jgi:hypothetical protein